MRALLALVLAGCILPPRVDEPVDSAVELAPPEEGEVEVRVLVDRLVSVTPGEPLELLFTTGELAAWTLFELDAQEGEVWGEPRVHGDEAACGVAVPRPGACSAVGWMSLDASTCYAYRVHVDAPGFGPVDVHVRVSEHALDGPGVDWLECVVGATECACVGAGPSRCNCDEEGA